MDIGLQPHCSACFNYLKEGREDKKTVWLVPTIVRKKQDELIIVWRCNWGSSCESRSCIYSRPKGDEGPLERDIRLKGDEGE